MGNKSSSVKKSRGRDQVVGNFQQHLDNSSVELSTGTIQVFETKGNSLFNHLLYPSNSKKDSFLSSDKDYYEEKENLYLENLYKGNRIVRTNASLSNNHILYLLNNSLLAPKKDLVLKEKKNRDHNELFRVVIEENNDEKIKSNKLDRKKKKPEKKNNDRSSNCNQYNQKECPICFLENKLNTTSCCNESICTDCFILLLNQFHLKNIGESLILTSSTSSVLDSGMNCPFCYSNDLRVSYNCPKGENCEKRDNFSKEVSLVDDEFKLFSEGTDSSYSDDESFCCTEESQELEKEDVVSNSNTLDTKNTNITFASVKEREELEKKMKMFQDQALSDEGLLTFSEWENNFAFPVRENTQESRNEERLKVLLSNNLQLNSNNTEFIYNISKENNFFDLNQLEEFLVNQAIQKSLK